jgi:activator of HSP90 ATPase
MDERNKKLPLNVYRDGAVNVRIWEQSGNGGQSYVNASIGRLYKDNKTSLWHESKSFSDSDLVKLQALLPQVRQEMQHWQDSFRANEAAMQAPQQQIAPAIGAAQPNPSLAAQRDTLMQEASQSSASSSAAQSKDQTQTQSQQHTQGHTPSGPGQGHSR